MGLAFTVTRSYTGVTLQRRGFAGDSLAGQLTLTTTAKWHSTKRSSSPHTSAGRVAPQRSPVLALHPRYPPKEGYVGADRTRPWFQVMGIRPAGDTTAPEAPVEGRSGGVRPLAAHELDSALHVIEAAQALARGDDLAEMLAGLARQLTEFTDATACLISVVDAPRGVIRNRAGYARPPHRWAPGATEHTIADYPRTKAVIDTGRPYVCVRGAPDADPSEARWLPPRFQQQRRTPPIIFLPPMSGADGVR